MSNERLCILITQTISTQTKTVRVFVPDIFIEPQRKPQCSFYYIILLSWNVVQFDFGLRILFVFKLHILFLLCSVLVSNKAWPTSSVTFMLSPKAYTMRVVHTNVNSSVTLWVPALCRKEQMPFLPEHCNVTDVFKNSKQFSQLLLGFHTARNALLKFRMQYAPFSAFCCKANVSCKVLSKD